ncbi:hypothetical protein AHAS_Ahas09G0149600 [Arachis hypogaea]
MGSAPMTLAVFLKFHPPSFRGSTNPGKRITGSKLWNEHYKHSMSRTINTWSFLLISFGKRPSIDGRQNAVCYSSRTQMFLGMYFRQPSTRSIFLSLQGKRRRRNLCN